MDNMGRSLLPSNFLAHVGEMLSNVNNSSWSSRLSFTYDFLFAYEMTMTPIYYTVFQNINKFPSTILSI
jgi:hypothetical protein